MATIRFSINPGDSLEAVVVAAGAAVVTKKVELTIEQANVITDGGASRAIKKGEVLVALKQLEAAVINDKTLFQ